MGYDQREKRKTHISHYPKLVVIKLITSFTLVRTSIFFIFTTISSTFGFPSGPVYQFLGQLWPAPGPVVNLDTLRHRKSAYWRCKVSRGSGILASWITYRHHDQVGAPTARVGCGSTGPRVDLVSKWLKLWLSKEHKDLGASWHSSPSLHFRTSRTASFTSHPCHKTNTFTTHHWFMRFMMQIHANTRLFSIWSRLERCFNLHRSMGRAAGLLFWSLGPVTCFGHAFPEVPFGSKDGAWHSWLADRSNSSVEEEWSFEATPCSQNESNFCRESVYHAVCSIFMSVQHDSKTAWITGWHWTDGALKVWHKTAPRKSIYR